MLHIRSKPRHRHYDKPYTSEIFLKSRGDKAKAIKQICKECDFAWVAIGIWYGRPCEIKGSDKYHKPRNKKDKNGIVIFKHQIRHNANGQQSAKYH